MQKANPYPRDKKVSKITSLEQWTSGHDDSSIFIDVYDESGKRIWGTEFEVYFGSGAEEMAGALGAYLEFMTGCSVGQSWFS